MPFRSVKDVIRGQTVLCLPPGAMVRAAAKAMAERRVGSVMVVEGGRLVGIFTERDALSRVLAAGLDPDATPLEQVMTSKLITITPDRPLVFALHLMQDYAFRHLPVVDNGRPIGVVSIRDALGSEIIRLEREERVKQEIAEVMR
jgi:CBS domain-containing protein